jgi:protease-4
MRRTVLLVFTLIGLATFASVAGLALMAAIIGREPAVRAGSTLVLRVPGPLAEEEPSGFVGQLLDTAPTVRSVVDNLRKARHDGRVKGVVLIPADAQGLWGKTQEVRDAVLAFKESGKPIVAYLEYGGDQQYYLASACDRVFLLPTSPLDLTGLASYELFLRGTLDKIGAHPDLLHIGDYKTAANTFTEKTFTPAHREMAESLNTDLFEQLVSGIAEGRRKSVEEVRALIDRGPFLPEEAVRVGLVDDLAYEDQIDDKVDLGGSEAERLEGDEYSRVSLASFGLNEGPRIAVIYATGLIARGESNPDSPNGPVLGSDTLIKSIRTARADDSVRAIVLRVDSPGGSAIASDVIWREIWLAREEKPIIASMSDVAASGGYYIAMPAHAIVAQPATLTGSIGVVVGKIVTGGSFDKLGLNIEAVSRGRFAEINSPDRPYGPEERAKIEEQMQAIYDAFVEKAAQGRNTTPERIDAVAQGRVWTGRQAKELGLVDELGGLDRAIALAKSRANIPDDEEVEMIIYPARRPFYEMVRNPFSVAPARFGWGSFASAEVRALARLASPLLLFSRGEPLALMPNFSVR